VLLPISLVTIMGPVALVQAAGRVSGSRRQVATIGLVGAVAGLALLAVFSNPWAGVLATGRLDARRQTEMPEVGRQIVAMANGGSCSVLTALVPNITWTTSCAAFGFGDPPRAGQESLLTSSHRFLVLLSAADPRQPVGELRTGYLALTDGPPVQVRNPLTGNVAAMIYRLR
jgi:hypothetical protein